MLVMVKQVKKKKKVVKKQISGNTTRKKSDAYLKAKAALKRLRSRN